MTNTGFKLTGVPSLKRLETLCSRLQLSSLEPKIPEKGGFCFNSNEKGCSEMINLGAAFFSDPAGKSGEGEGEVVRLSPFRILQDPYGRWK